MNDNIIKTGREIIIQYDANKCACEIANLWKAYRDLRSYVYSDDVCCVVSVNGKSGVVTLLTTDLPDFPSQTGNGGKFLSTDGTNLFWDDAGSSSGTLTAANEGTSLSGTTVQLGQTLNQAGDPAAFTTAREIYTGTSLNNYFRIRGASTQKYFFINHGDNDGVFRFSNDALLETIIKADGYDYGWVKMWIQNNYDGAVGPGFAGSAAGIHISNNTGGIGQIYLGHSGNGYISDGLMVRSGGGVGGLRLTADVGLITFTTDVTGTGEFARFTGTTTRRFGILTGATVDTTLHVVGDLKFVTGNQGTNKVLTSDVNGVADWSTFKINQLAAANGSNDINNGDFGQVWRFNSLSSGTGFAVYSDATTAGSNGQTAFSSTVAGINANSNQVTYGAKFFNIHSGTGSVNVAAQFEAINGDENIAARFYRGKVSFGVAGVSSTPIEISGSTSGTITIQPATAAGTYTLTLPTSDGNPNEFLQTDGSGVLSWNTTPSTLYSADGTIATNRTVDLDGKTVTFQQGGNTFLLINPATDGEETLIRAYNTTGDGNFSRLSVQTSSTSATGTLEATFNDGIKTAYIVTFADATTASISFLSDKIFLGASSGTSIIDIDGANLAIKDGSTSFITLTSTGVITTINSTKFDIADTSLAGASNGYVWTLVDNATGEGAWSVASGAVAWNSISNPTGDQALTFDAGESSTWTSSNTTEDLLTINTSTLTTASLLSLNSTSTALAAGNNLAEFIMSGANGSSSITATGVKISVTNTGTTSTNYGIDVTATGATNNVALLVTGSTGSSSSYAARFTGRVAMGGVTTPFSDLDVGNGTIATGSIIVTTAAGTNQTGNFSTGSQGLVGSNVGSIYQILGSSTVNSHVFAGGTGATAVGVGLPAATMMIGAASLVEATSGNHPLLAGLVIVPPTITGAAGTVTDGATLYIDGPTAGTVSGTNAAIQVRTGNVEVRNGDLSLGTAGNKLKITTGSNASVGVSGAMTGGTITISTTAVTANSIIFLTHATVAGTQGILSVGTITAGTSFVINSSNGADTGTVNYWILN